MRTKLYLTSLVLLLLYATAYLFDFISPNFSYPVDNGDEHVLIIVMMYYFPIYTFITGLFCLKMKWYKRIFISLLLAILMLCILQFLMDITKDFRIYCMQQETWLCNLVTDITNITK